MAADGLVEGPVVVGGFAQHLQGAGQGLLRAGPVEGAVGAGDVFQNRHQVVHGFGDLDDVGVQLGEGRARGAAGGGHPRPGQGLVAGVETGQGLVQPVHGHAQGDRVGGAGAEGGEQLQPVGAGADGAQAGGGAAAGLGVQVGDRVFEGGGGLGDARRVAATQGRAGADHGAAGAGQGRAGVGGDEGFGEGDIGRGVQALVAEELGAQEGAESLLASGASPGVGAHGAGEAARGQFGAGGGLAEGAGVAGAPGDLAPDDGGLQLAAGPVPGGGVSDREVGGAGLGAQQVHVEQFEQAGVAAGQAFARTVGLEETLQLAAKLKHANALRTSSVPSRDVRRELNAQSARSKPKL